MTTNLSEKQEATEYTAAVKALSGRLVGVILDARDHGGCAVPAIAVMACVDAAVVCMKAAMSALKRDGLVPNELSTLEALNTLRTMIRQISDVEAAEPTS